VPKTRSRSCSTQSPRGACAVQPTSMRAMGAVAAPEALTTECGQQPRASSSSTTSASAAQPRGPASSQACNTRAHAQFDQRSASAGTTASLTCSTTGMQLLTTHPDKLVKGKLTTMPPCSRLTERNALAGMPTSIRGSNSKCAALEAARRRTCLCRPEPGGSSMALTGRNAATTCAW